MCGFILFWVFISITYAILTFKNYIAYRQIKKLANEGNNVYFYNRGIKVGDSPPNGTHIDVLDMFYSIFKIDLIALFIGFLAAVISILRIM